MDWIKSASATWFPPKILYEKVPIMKFKLDVMGLGKNDFGAIKVQIGSS